MKRLIFFIAVAVFIFSYQISAQNVVLKPEKVLLPEAYTTTIPLRDMDIIPPTEKTDWKNGIVPNKELTPAQRNKTGKNPPIYGSDPVLQKIYSSSSSSSSKGVIQNFEGIGNLCNCAPPDTDGDVGPNHYIQMVNNAFQIFNKSGTALTPAANLSTIWSSLPGPWVGTSNGDPIVLYDEIADRWLLTQFSLPNYPNGPFYELLAVSATSDPTGSYHLYAYSFTDMPDYPKFGVWPDGYYMSINQFSSGLLNWAGAGAVVFERSQMLNGNAAQMVFFNFTSAQDPWSFLPSDVDGPVPPSGTPNYFVYLEDVFSTGIDRLRIHALSVDWVNTANSTFTGPTDLNVAAFNPIVSGIPQPGSGQTLDPLSSRLMYRLQYRNFGSYQTMITNHTVNAGSGAGVRWYELRNTGSGWYVYQQGTYAPTDGNRRWMASVAMNVNGDIALGYSIAGGIAPSIRYTGRLSTDALGTMTIPETTVITGSGAQTGTNRWGDYSAMSVDPSDDYTFWYTQEYVNPGGNFAWRTRINSMQIGSPPSNPPVANFVADNTMPANSFTTVNFTDLSTNTPTSWLWTFSPSTVTYFSGSSTSQNPSVRFNSPGAYTVTLTATNAYGSDPETKIDYIHMGQPGVWTGGTSGNPMDWNTATNWENHLIPTSTDNVFIYPTAINWPTKTGNLTIGTDCNSLVMASGYTELTVTGNLTIASGNTFNVDVAGIPNIYVGGSWIGTGTFNPGQSTVIMNGSSNASISGPSGTANIFYDGFEGASAWSLSGEFQVASPVGLGGEHGNPDPSSAYLGANVLGVDITGLGIYPGDYETSLANRAYQAISPTINCTGYTNVSMNFQRWLGVESPAYDHAYIDISNNNGSTWTQIWTNSAVVQESSWGLQNINISSYADNQAQVKIRFCIGSSDGSWQYCGWNIDEFNVTGTGTFNALFSNLTIEKSNAVVSTLGNVDVQNNFIIKPAAQFTNSSGNNLNVNGGSLFMADNTGMASFVDNGTSNFAIPPDVQLYLTPARWHFVSTPVNGAQSGVFIDNYLRTFDEATDSWNPYITPTNIPLSPMLGYAAWVPGATPDVVTFNGSLNNGLISIGVTKNSTSTNIGWNLVGNPYPSSLNWDAAGWGKGNIDNTIYFYSGVNGLSNYHYYIGSGSAPYTGIAVNDGTNEIPPMQGFFVHATSNGNLTVNNQARIHSGQAYYKSREDEGAKVKLIRMEVNGNGLKDEAVIRFIPQATANFDGQYDAYKLFAHDYPQVYTLAANTELAVNTLPSVDEGLVIPVNFTAPVPESYTLTFKEINGFDAGVLYLEDILTGNIEEISTNKEYQFDYSPLYSDNRFLIHFSNPLGIVNNTLNLISVYAFEKTVYVQLPKNSIGQIAIYDMMGREIINNRVAGEEMVRIKLDTGTGYYLVKVQTGSEVVTKNVFIR